MEKVIKKIIKNLRLKKKGEVMGCVLCMTMVVLVSQSRLFEYIIESNLGRIGMLGLILSIFYTSKMFGVASLLFLVLAFAVHMNTREGMETKKCEKCDSEDCTCNKEGMCKKRKENFGNMSHEERLDEERKLQNGNKDKEVKKTSSSGAEPYEKLGSEIGSDY